MINLRFVSFYSFLMGKIIDERGWGLVGKGGFEKVGGKDKGRWGRGGGDILNRTVYVFVVMATLGFLKM